MLKRNKKTFLVIGIAFLLLLFISITITNFPDKLSKDNVLMNSSKNTVGVVPEVTTKDSYRSLAKDKESTSVLETSLDKIKLETKSNMTARKIILSGSMVIETTGFDKAIENITSRVQVEGGYIENSTINGVKAQNGNYLENRIAEFSIRIPSGKFEGFMLKIGNLGIVTSKTTNGEDITSQYYDSATRLKSQKIKEARLLDILKKAKNLTDVLAVESELETTRYEIETLTGNIKEWDNLVSYSTLTLTLKEVNEKKTLVKKPTTLLEKISYSFNSSIELLVDLLKGSLIAIVALFPFVIIAGIIFSIIKVILIRRKKHKKEE